MRRSRRQYNLESVENQRPAPHLSSVFAFSVSVPPIMKLLEKLLFKGPMSLRTYSNALVSVVWILYELVGYLTFLPVKRTRAITLLITGSVFFTGCSKQTPSSDEWGGEEKPSASPAATNGYSMGHSLGWWFLASRFIGGGSSFWHGSGPSAGGASEASSGSVSRGGFGSTAGHASASS